MSDEESFVILGSCSLRSNESIRSDFGSLEQSKIEKDNATNDTANVSLHDKTEINKMPSNPEKQTNGHLSSLERSTEREQTLTGSVNTNMEKDSVDNKQSSYEVFEKTVDKAMQRSSESDRSVANTIHTTMNRSSSSGGSNAQNNGSLAASFIMGEVQADVLKSSVYSQFPSLCSLESSAEDIVKLQNFMSEYVELKSTLNTVNGTMRQFYNKTQQWRDEMHKTELSYKEQLQNCKQEIVTLRNENLELKQELLSKMELMHINEESQQKEIAALTESVSEKTALIENMRHQIARLEEQQLASFDFMSKHEYDTKDHSDYIARSEHLLAIKELERKMSAIVAENYELKDMTKVYVDEINCLKVNLVSAEELLNQTKNDIDLLKSQDIEKSKLFENYEKEREQLREEMGLLRQQVEVYSKDFQMERTARESLAGEKDQLVQDLRALQRSNQQLIEEQQRRIDNVRNGQAASTDAASSTASATATPPQVSPRIIANPPNAAVFEANLQQRPIRHLPQPTPAARKETSRFDCPICFKGFDSLAVLQNHVNICLDTAKK